MYDDRSYLQLAGATIRQAYQDYRIEINKSHNTPLNKQKKLYKESAEHFLFYGKTLERFLLRFGLNVSLAHFLRKLARDKKLYNKYITFID